MIHFKSEYYRFRKQQFSNFKIMYKRLIALVIKSEIKVNQFIQREILKSTASWNDYVRHFRTCYKGPIILIVFRYTQFWINNVQLILK